MIRSSQRELLEEILENYPSSFSESDASTYNLVLPLSDMSLEDFWPTLLSESALGDLYLQVSYTSEADASDADADLARSPRFRVRDGFEGVSPPTGAAYVFLQFESAERHLRAV